MGKVSLKIRCKKKLRKIYKSLERELQKALINNQHNTQIKTRMILIDMLAFIYKGLLHFDVDFNHQIQTALEACRDKSNEEKYLKQDILSEYVYFGVRPMEYAKFDFSFKSERERREYLTDYDVYYIYEYKADNNVLPDSKFERYQMFRRFFRRDVLCIRQEDVSASAYQAFLRNKEAVVVKPLRGTKGHGVAIVKTSEIPDFDAWKEKYAQACLLEEVIEQGDEMKQFHPDSVNTVRFVTGVDPSGVFHPVFALVRVGQGGSVVDNVGSGGLVALINMDRGEICTDACCGTIRYETHPDTGMRFRGFQIPEWEKLCALAKEIHLSQKGQRLFGLDLAWSKHGWDLVEVNPAPSFDSFQELTGCGARPYLRTLGLLPEIKGQGTAEL